MRTHSAVEVDFSVAPNSRNGNQVESCTVDVLQIVKRRFHEPLTLRLIQVHLMIALIYMLLVYYFMYRDALVLLYCCGACSHLFFYPCINL